MLKLILIDDEQPALDWLEYLLREEPLVRVAGRYTDAREALARLEEWDADAVLVDIEMPSVNGLEAAETILSRKPGIAVVFVTAYNQYAIEAFELNAADYIVKPVAPERLKKTVERLLSRPLRDHDETPPADDRRSAPLQVRMLGAFEIFFPAEPDAAIKWRTAKERELTAYLLHHRNQGVSRQKILEEVWNGVPYEQAAPFLHTSVSNIRKKFAFWGERFSLVFQNGHYLLRTEDIRLDTEQLERTCRLPEPLDEETAAAILAELERSEGDYLGEEGFHWAAEEQVRLQRLLLEAGKRAGGYYLRTRRYPQAETVYRRLLRINPYADDLNERMLEALAESGDRAAMKRHYDSFVDLLSRELGIGPRESTVQLHLRLLNETPSG